MRVKGGWKTRARVKKVLKEASGYRGARSRQFVAAQEAVDRSRDYAYHGRKLRKRDFRSLWISRTRAAANANGISYSKLINLLKKSRIDLDRKALAEIALHDEVGFKSLVEAARQA